MMRRIVLSMLLVCSWWSMSAQIRLKGYHEDLLNPALKEGRWSARWIGVPDVNLREYGVYHFRRTFDLEKKPERYVIHVTADNRYKLYVNGTEVALGPCRGDLNNWNFETVDIAPQLSAGRNVVAAVVWNFAELRPAAQMTTGEAGFLLQGNTEAERAIDTDGQWRCMKDEAYGVCRDGRVRGYFAAGPNELIDAAKYPKGWELKAFDDNGWKKARVLGDAAMKGAIDYPGRLLVPRNLPPMEMRKERLQRVRLAEGIKAVGDFLKRPVKLSVPANTKIRLLLDQGKETTGYATLQMSGGRGANVTLGYAETLFTDTGNGNLLPLGDRNEVRGKTFIGYADRIVSDGSDHFQYTPLWWRTWRYIELTVETKDEPLVLEDFYGTFSAYPFQRKSRFHAAGDDDLEKMLDVGWQTARLCANETYMDCPYYEQLQYFGDTRIQTMVTMYNTDDQYMVKQALEQGRRSMLPDGLTYSRFPTGIPQIISSYALSWTGMVYDYWMYRGDDEYVKSLLPQCRQVMAWFEQWLKPDGSLDVVPYWFFCDWASGLASGSMPNREKDGNSAYQDLVYLMALDEMAKMEQTVGLKAMADHYAATAGRIRKDFDKKYWDAERGLYADTKDHRSYSQHTNIMAILTEVTKGESSTALCEKLLTEKGIIQASIYFRYYLFMAMMRAGMGDKYLDELGIWRQQLREGMTTWAEKPEPTRSDCHAWGASPNVELFRILLGIDTAAPGFQRVHIKPALGSLRQAAGTMPHPKGEVSVSYRIDANGQMHADIILPQDVDGTFTWHEKNYPLHGGRQRIVAD